MLNPWLAVISVCLVVLTAWTAASKPSQSCLKIIAALEFDEVFNATRHPFQLTSERTLAYNDIGSDHACHKYFKETLAPSMPSQPSDQLLEGPPGDAGLGSLVRIL